MEICVDDVCISDTADNDATGCVVSNIVVKRLLLDVVSSNSKLDLISDDEAFGSDDVAADVEYRFAELTVDASMVC